MVTHSFLTSLTQRLPLTPRRGLIIMVAALLLAMPAPAWAEYVSVQRDKINIRSGPGTDHEILWEVFRDFPLKIVARQGDWAQIVDFEDDRGWIYTPLLDNEKRVIVRVDTANLRVGPGTNYEVKATVRYGVVFEPIERRQDWIKLQHSDGTTGWMSTNLVWPSDII
ncbi:SH3 domain-containing protein [Desulfurivibrio dismutans]|uniref:SH3 domain-containing protein n=1 Tax=Desulfurivibrio dismutans TaxID=1398908 RepID=UPI0023D99881|nr:SH3 domain-containing protein [Desulfurivibrio alkaliphilus]MDF1614616.1 SH3 domain-containing protein [Desulfurivibrio alkaliphilus]